MYTYGARNENRARNVVVYARVSTEHEAQLSALENQKDWYKGILAQYPEWKFVRQYVDVYNQRLIPFDTKMAVQTPLFLF